MRLVSCANSRPARSQKDAKVFPLRDVEQPSTILIRWSYKAVVRPGIPPSR